MKGIILAGGTGSRLHPITLGVSKHLLPVYDKPMIYYPLSLLMMANVRDILIISDSKDIKQYERILKDGNQLGINISYKIQDKPEGLAQAFTLGEKFIDSSSTWLALGDNIFHGQGLGPLLSSTSEKNSGATVFGYNVANPSSFGIVEIDKNNKPVSIEEKPKDPKSNWAVTGLYHYDSDIVEIAKSIKKSKRGEYEISSINQIYLQNKNLNLELLGRGYAWLDCGTENALLEASQYIGTIQQRLGLLVSCPEEIALSKGWINQENVLQTLKHMGNNSYSKYLYKLCE